MILVPEQKIADYVARGWWGERTLGDVFIDAAERQPGHLAVADPPNRPALTGTPAQRWSWGELLHQVGLYAEFLSRQGMRKDDVLVLQLPNVVEMHALYLACAASGIIVSPVPMQYRAHELSHVLNGTGARMAITATRVGNYLSARQWAEHRALFPRLEQIWALDPSPVRPELSPVHPELSPVHPELPPVRPELVEGHAPRRTQAALPAGVGSLTAALSRLEPWSAARLRQHALDIGLSAHDVFTVCWTSGTEAQPKGVPRNHNEWLIVGQSVVDAGQLQPGAQLLIPFPFVNMAGVSTSLAAWLLVAGAVHHHHPFDIDVFVEQLRGHPIDYTVAAPAVLSALLKNPDQLRGVDLGRLRRIGSGGGPVADWLVEQFGKRFGVEIVNYFGSNEGAALSSTPQDIPDRRQRAQYFPRMGVPGYDWSLSNARKISTRLVDLDSGEDITGPGRVGELRFKGPTIFSGYFNAPDLTARAFDDQGYYRTGDLFELAGDRLQFYRFAGRHKDIVIRGGMNISCEEVESLLLGHPKVREVAMIGYPDPDMGERLCAAVVPQHGAAPELAELVAYLRNEQEVAAFKLPERLLVLAQLPRNPVGKVLKRELRALLAAGAVKEAA